MIYAFLITAMFHIAAVVADVRLTDRGIKKGVAVEANRFIVWMYGRKPNLVELYTANFLISAPMLVSGILGHQLNLDILIWMSLGSMISFGAKHLRGAYRWAKLGA